MKKLYFLGPKGTYSELGANKIKNILNYDLDLIPVSTIAKIVDLVSKDENSLAVLPIENSIEGIVRPTIDSFLFNDIKINAQFEIEINHCLLSKGVKSQIKHIISHPQAIAQCQKYILNNFDENIELIETSSTAKAVYDLKDKDETYAAIASRNAQNSFNIIDENIGDVKDNKTRFILVSKIDLKLASPIRTSIVFNTRNEPGALLRILEIFNKYNINMVYIESRPSKKVFGKYNFFVDVDKGVNEILSALNEIESVCNFYKFLGSYPCV